MRKLRQGIAEKFPDFQKNAYYREYTGQEEQALIAMQQKSDLRFYLYYRLKLLVRRLRK